VDQRPLVGVQLAFEVLTGRTTSGWKSRPRSDRNDGVQDAAQLASPVGGLDGLDHGIVGVVLNEPHAAAHPRIAGQGPTEHTAVVQCDRAGSLALVDLGETS
jgi:hypothetical protein